MPCSGKGRPRGRALLAALALLLSFAWPAAIFAQTAPGEPIGTGCRTRLECLRNASRVLWDRYSREIEVAGAEYNQALDRYQRAQQLDRPDLLSRAKQQLDLKEAKLRHARSVLRTVVSTEYKGDLQANLAKATKLHSAAVATLQKYEAAWQRLQSATGAQRQAILRDIEGTIKEQERLRVEIAWGGVVAAMHAGAAIATAPPSALRQALSPERLEQVGKLGHILEGGAAGIMIGRDPGHAMIEVVHVGTMAAAAGLAGLSAPALLAIGVAPALTGMALDGAILYAESSQRRAAERRLQELGGVEKYWEERIAIAKADVLQLELRREIAQQLITEQQKIGAIGARGGP